MEMNKENNTPFKAEDVNWDELAGIGILKDELEMAGELDTLLSGEKTNVVSKGITDKLRITKLRLYVSGSNLLTFSSLYQGLDPEGKSDRINDFPPLKIVNFGVNIIF